MSDQQVIPADQNLPNVMPIIALSGKPIFPGIITPLMLSSEKDVQIVDAASQKDGIIGLVLTKDADVQSEDAENLHRVGTAARIIKKINLPDGGINIIITTQKRFLIRKFLQATYPVLAAVTYPQEDLADTIEIKAFTRSLLGEMKQISENNPLFSEEMRLSMVNIDHPGRIADFIAGILNIERKEQQKILETFDVRKRMEQVLIFIKKEQELMKIQKKIQGQINEKIEKSQRDYYLREQLKLIKQELGIASDAKTSEAQRFQELHEKLKLPKEVAGIVEKELEKFQLMDPNSAEYSVTRNYLDTVLSLPWTSAESKTPSLEKARKILDADHFGLEDVKERILEFLAVRQLKKDYRGSILCLVGPPGVGKTSIGKSIAKALKKEFFRFSVGGMRDEAEIKGHRRTYVGAMPGKIIQGLKITKANDPVFMIDEIDKLGSSYQGDPSSALLEVLDPEQNIAFRDHYLDIPFDISRVLFIATANTLDTIPAPLLDRMEIIRLSGYIAGEKVSIAQKYLVPRTMERNGLKKGDVSFTKSSLLAIAESYAREAGVRTFEKLLEKILRKIAKSVVVGDKEPPFSIDSAQLEEYLGKPVFKADSEYKRLGAGVVTGLAWTSLGGDTLNIESIALPGKEGLVLTGQLGAVMQESANIALSWVRSMAAGFSIDETFFSKNGIHLHIPAGATPKDGPSAGITMACCLLSLATKNPVAHRLAMTGELSLTGQVLPIGGLKEKTIAAKRAGIQRIIIPADNVRDLDEIPAQVKKGILFHPVHTMGEVAEIAFSPAKGS